MTKKRKTNSVTNLKAALIDLLLEMEYSKITIGNITQRANVSRGTFINIFLIRMISILYRNRDDAKILGDFSSKEI